MQFQVEVEVDEGAGQGEVGKMLYERGQHGEYPRRRCEEVGGDTRSGKHSRE